MEFRIDSFLPCTASQHDRPVPFVCGLYWNIYTRIGTFQLIICRCCLGQWKSGIDEMDYILIYLMPEVRHLSGKVGIQLFSVIGQDVVVPIGYIS